MATTREIRHIVRINAKPRAIYQALMNSKTHTAFTGAPAKIDAKVGGRFTAWGPYLQGVTVDLVKNKRIVQAWRAKSWPNGHYSIATFELKPAKGGSVLVFTQTGIPAKHVRDINGGWKSHYWDLLKKAFNKSPKS
jgi:activator of HSP90 ATPase